MSYVRYTEYRHTTSYVHIVCFHDIVRQRTTSCDTDGIVGRDLNLSCTMSFVQNRHTISYVHDIRYHSVVGDDIVCLIHDVRCRLSTYDIVCQRQPDVQCRISFSMGCPLCFKGPTSPAQSIGKRTVPFLQQSLPFQPRNKAR